ncbi:uncharacterized protein LOC9647744 [Selaginella moellendorffii]|uniref:uncharacterized protein LOC9647744 n=1 Tax=Selaginella moellendorffii TaxID=88036 RepID=UPI000D1CE60B|nr:uncharacterized protein LOC9647744 [Selaginella moellendorffii]|eukprot:XP_024541196.1 uncharacterized protein LOC9647744 [Selaginella moellendorffii]
MSDARIAWQVELAQFVPPFEGLHRRFLAGSWIISKSAATLTINSASATLAIVLNGNVYEEHCVPDLSFAWPRTTGSSRVILASYAISGTTYKFGMRFENDEEASKCFKILEAAASIPRGTLESVVPKIYSEMDWTAPGAPDQFIPEVIETNSPNGARSNTSGAGSVLPDPEVVLALPCPGSSNKPSAPALKDQIHTSNSLISTKPSGPELKEQILKCLMDPSFPAFVNEVEKIWHEIGHNVETLQT